MLHLYCVGRVFEAAHVNGPSFDVGGGGGVAAAICIIYQPPPLVCSQKMLPLKPH